MNDIKANLPRVNAVVICAGLTLSLLLATLTLWGGLPIHELTGLDIAQIVEYWTLALMISLSLTLVASLIVRHSLASRLFLLGSIFCSVLLACGCGLLFAANNSTAIIFSGICIGVGLGLTWLLWQESLNTLDSVMFSRIPFIALALSSALYLLIATAGSITAQLAVTVICIFATFILLITTYVIHQKSLPSTTPSSALTNIPVSIPISAPTSDFASASAATVAPFPFASAAGTRTSHSSPGHPYKTITEDAFFVKLWKPIVCAAAMSAMVLLTRFPALSFVDDPNLVNISAHVGILVTAVIIIIGQFGLNKGLSLHNGKAIETIYYAAFPIIATALLALLLGGASMAIPVAALTYAGFTILVVTLMPTSIVLARESDVSAVHVYGILLGSVYIAGSIVTILGNSWIFVAESEPAGIIALVSVLTLYVLAISVFLLRGPFEKWINRRNNTAKTANAEVPETQINAQQDNSFATKPTAIQSLATSHGLTDREGDILELILRGRDAQNIASSLFISVNTVRSHSKSIYRKLGIHSKQELLDLVEKGE